MTGRLARTAGYARATDLAPTRVRPRLPAARTSPPKADRVRRETHPPDFAILVAVMALTAIGLLMVYSSSAMKAYLTPGGDMFGIVGPQIQWAGLGVVAMIAMSRLDYRYLRLVSIPLFVIAFALLVLVLLLPVEGPLHAVRVGGSARWLQLEPLPAIHPAEFAKLAVVVYLAHWMAKRGTAVRSLLRGTLPFLVIFGPVAALVLAEPDLGTTTVIGLTGLTMFFVAGASLWQLMALGGAAAGIALVGLRGYQSARIEGWLDPWAHPLGDGFHTIQGLLALALGGLVGAGLGESRLAGGLFLPNATNDFIFAIIGEEFGLLGGTVVVALFLILAYQGIRTAIAAPDTFGSLLAIGITAWLTFQAFINIGVVVALIPITGITLPFVSAGGSSLVVSFAAVGILLSISRETVERGSWNDASADRGRGHGRTHLPGSRRRTIAPRATGRT